jgi:hypothetical protein
LAQDEEPGGSGGEPGSGGGLGPRLQEKIKHFSSIKPARGKALRLLNGKTKPARIGAFCVRHQEKEPCG